MWCCEFLSEGFIHRCFFPERSQAEAFQDLIAKIAGLSSVVHIRSVCK